MPDTDYWQFWLRPAVLISFLLSATIIGLAWLAVIFHLEGEMKLAVIAAQQNTGNLACTFEQQVIQIIDETDKILQALQTEYASDPERFGIDSARRYQGNWTEHFAIFDAAGFRRATTYPAPGEGGNDKDWDFFRVHIDDDKAGLFISKPIVGKLSGRTTILFSRRLTLKDGAFGGVIVAFVYTDTLSRFYDGIDVGKDGVIALWGTDGILRASRGFKADVSRHTPTPLLDEVSKAPIGFYLTPGLDGVRRFLSYRKLASWPLIVAVGVAQPEVFANSWNKRGTYYSAAALLTVLILLVTAFGMLRERRLHLTTLKAAAAQEAQRKAQDHAQALVEESRDNLAQAERMALLGHFKIMAGSNEYTWSEGAYRILGKSPESFTPTRTSVLELVHPDDRVALEQYRRDVWAGLDRHPLTVRAVKDDGEIIHVERWSRPLRAGDGTVIGMFGTLQDVTARKAAEEVLARSKQDLERLVNERTAQLEREMRKREEAQAKFLQVQKMEAVGQLTAGIAHDFNNLLAVIQGGLEFVQASTTKGLPANAELIEVTARATRRGAELVQRLLAFSRQKPLRAEPTSIDRLVLDTLQLLQRTLGEAIDIVTCLEASAAATCLVDRNQFINALVNLAVNARDAMPEGGQLTIATVCQASPWAGIEGSSRWPTGEEVCVTISDTGIGMTEEVGRRAFEPFFTTKPDGLGTGLGLSMVHGFVEQSGGHTEIDSAGGTGTTIKIHLPRIETAGQADEPTAPAAAPSNAHQKTVLLVEDDPDVRVMTAAQLKWFGYRVLAAANGDEAIHLIESPTNIDIIVTDIVLPGGIDGVTLVKEAMRARPNMGVLCMSGYAPSQNHSKWYQVQNIGLLEKPFSRDQLARALETAVAA